jgi:hypothetical protein
MNAQAAPGRLSSVVLMLVALAASACGPTTVFASSWRSPKAEPLAMRDELVAAVVMVKNEGTRRNAEDVLAREISHYGAAGVAMYTLMEEAPAGNEAKAKAAIERAGVKGVVVMRPIGRRTKTETSEYYSDPYYSGYWGGYYGYGWGNVWAYPGSSRGALVAGPPVVYGGSPGPSVETVTTTTEVVEVEVLVYSLKQNLLVWAGVSQTTDAPEKVDDFVVQLAGATVREMGSQGLLQSN